MEEHLISESLHSQLAPLVGLIFSWFKLSTGKFFQS